MPKAFTFVKLPYALLLCIALSTSANAIILFGADNTANLSAPSGSALPFDTVARVASGIGVENGGSGVHLGGGYMLTAAHIGNSELASVTFDGSTFYTRDLSYIPTQIGTTDMKIFKLNTTPTVGSVNLYTGSLEVVSGDGFLVGWGRGRADGSTIGANTVPVAGGGTPLVKRWGTNDPTRELSGATYTVDSGTYTSNLLETVQGNSEGATEAAATPRDSGSGYFQEIGSIWYLTGLTSVISQQNPGNVTFGLDIPATGVLGTGDPNYFTKISSYASQINTLVPEPSTLALTLATLPFFLRRRR
ncbi:MAG: PEP-CTERM sorting domain-containing protein [Luteolibacter sp.]